jgi:tetratricopeptide (TPR) repeat protein
MPIAGRHCSACSRPLSRYNDSSTCGPCEIVARATPKPVVCIPPTVWFEPAMRHALSAWDWQVVLTRIAEVTGASQTLLAELAAMSQPQVSRLMSGKGSSYDIRTIGRIVDRLGAPRHLAGLAPASATVDTTSIDEVGGLDRRSVLAVGAAVPLLAVVGCRETTVSVDHLASLRRAVEDLYALDDTYGGDAVAELAVHYLSQVDDLLNSASYSNSVGRQLRVIYGQLAEGAGWLHFDAGRYGHARRYYGEALQAAQLADDLELEVLVLTSMNALARYQNRPREALELALLAKRRAVGWATPRLSTLLAAREAICWAQTNDELASRNAFHQAQNVYRSARNDADPPWIDFFDQAELTALQGLAYDLMGHHAQAADLLGEALGNINPKFRRNQALYSMQRGLTFLRSGDEEAACATVESSLPLVSTVHSGRARKGLAEFMESLATNTAQHAERVRATAREFNLLEATP